MSILRGKIAILFWAATVTLAAKCGRKMECDQAYAPMCATFTQSFVNECEMKSEICNLAKKGFHFQSTTADPGFCKGTDTTDSGGECKIFVTWIPSPVCGSDGHTYLNSRAMEKAACLEGIQITEADQSTCPNWSEESRAFYAGGL